jgi:hypothetical protein
MPGGGGVGFVGGLRWTTKAYWSWRMTLKTEPIPQLHLALHNVQGVDLSEQWLGLPSK